MAILAETRSPAKFLKKLLPILLALLLLGAVGVTALSGSLVYQLFQPSPSPNTLDLELMMGHPSVYSFDIPGHGSREGWFFPGFRGAPTVILCHGYSTQKTDFLTLVTSLQDQHFNVFVFDFTGHGSVPGRPSFGYGETHELLAAVTGLAKRDDVDPRRFGVWGVDMGGYVALAAAIRDPRIEAVAVDSVYDDPHEAFRQIASQSGLASAPFVLRISRVGFDLANWKYRHEAPLSTQIVRLGTIPKFFVVSEDRPALAESTRKVFFVSSEPHTLHSDRLSYTQMEEEDRHGYETMVVTFFLQSLPIP